jgi:hypothetical protein
MICAALLSAGTAQAGIDVESLIKQKCTSCHGDELYTRADRKVTNLFELEKQLHRCNQVVGSNWDLDTVDAVMNYLNKKYYKFKE